MTASTNATAAKAAATPVDETEPAADETGAELAAETAADEAGADTTSTEKASTDKASADKTSAGQAGADESDADKTPETSHARTPRTELVRRGEGRGRTVVAETVVAKIAGIATREIDGVYSLGGAGERMVGKVRDVIPGTSSSVTQGIHVEVGEKQAAVDIEIVAEYGVAIHQLANAIRRNVVGAIEGMTGLEVAEVNVTVRDVHLPDAESDPNANAQPSRVE